MNSALRNNGILAHRYSTGDGTWSEWSYLAHQYDLNKIIEDYQTYDLNTLTEGFHVYKCNGSSSNLPVSGKFGHLMVMQASTESAYAVQVFFCELNGDGVWKRYQSGGSWTAWVRLIDSTNIGSQTVNKAKYASITAPGTAQSEKHQGRDQRFDRRKLLADDGGYLSGV